MNFVDLHCHLLPGVDDGAPDWDHALQIADGLIKAGFSTLAPSPHFGEGPGGDVDIDVANQLREDLRQRLAEGGKSLEICANAEHHITPNMLERMSKKNVVPVGGNSSWLLVELPWAAIPNVDEVLFQAQTMGYRLLLAHPERYHYLSLEHIEALVGRGVAMQIELGTLVGVYGMRAKSRLKKMLKRNLVHVAASDLHRGQDTGRVLDEGILALEKRIGPKMLERLLDVNPRRVLRDELELES